MGPRARHAACVVLISDEVNRWAFQARAQIITIQWVATSRQHAPKLSDNLILDSGIAHIEMRTDQAIISASK